MISVEIVCTHERRIKPLLSYPLLNKIFILFIYLSILYGELFALPHKV